MTVQELRDYLKQYEPDDEVCFNSETGSIGVTRWIWTLGREVTGLEKEALLPIGEELDGVASTLGTFKASF
jgi:hypothetical protein